MARRVLVVDDEPEIRAVLRAYLEHDGFLVTEAGTGAEALRRALTTDGTAPDLVLLDIGLPDLDGLEVLRTIRRSSDVYVVLVTARADEVDTLVGLRTGADDYVTKPFSPAEPPLRYAPEDGSSSGAACRAAHGLYVALRATPAGGPPVRGSRQSPLLGSGLGGQEQAGKVAGEGTQMR